MLSRLYKSLPAYSSWASNFIQTVKKYAVIALEKLFVQRSDSMTVIRIAPRQRIVLIAPEKLPPDKAMRLLKKIMYIEDETARKSYDFLPFLMGIQPFLSMQDKEGLVVRKKRIVPYLHAMRIELDYSDEMRILLDQLRKNNETTHPQPAQKIITNHLLSLFTRALLGVEFPEQLKGLLAKIERHPVGLLFALLPAWATTMLPLLPPIRKLRHEYNAAIKNFLVHEIEFIKNNYQQKDAIKKNWLIDILLEKVGDIHKISKKEIDALADDPEIRICIALILGTNNLARVITTLIKELFISPITYAIYETKFSLILEMESLISRGEYSLANLSNQEKMPLLHATYLEALRRGTKEFGIFRNTKMSIQVDDIYIPPHSLVSFPLHALLHIGSPRYRAEEFAPERFINESGQLSDEIKLHEGLFTPFGVGARMCPGHQIVEQIIKMYLVTLINSVNYFCETRVGFYNEEKKETAKSYAKSQLKVSISRHSLFGLPDNKKEEKIIEEIVENIAGYCL